MFHADDVPQGHRMGGMTYWKKAFAKRFDFDCVELRNLYRMSDSNATADVPWDEYIIRYISFSVGRLRCSFRHPGNCEGLTQWSERQASAPRSFYVCPEPKTINICWRG